MQTRAEQRSIYSTNNTNSRFCVKEGARVMGETMFEAIPRAVWDAHEAHLSGQPDAAFGVVSARPLSADATRALESSARKLGFGDRPCFFCTLHAQGRAGTSGDAATTGENGPADSAAQPDPIDASALFEVIEGLDPIVLVAADSEAARALSEAYRVEVAPMARSRVFGRTTVAFRSFEAMLGEAQDKQIAWALLKQLV